MRNLPFLFFGIFAALAASWTGLVLASHLQLGNLEPMTETYAVAEDGQSVLEEVPAAGEPRNPQEPVGLAQQGKLVYQDLGCIYCHSQQVRRQGFGADFERGWGNRATVPRDYVLQKRVLLGTMRTGPDLKTVGQRLPDANWHHIHLYDPQTVSEGSIMPPFRFLYEQRKIGPQGPSPNALSLPPAFAPPEGYEIVPTPRAEALVAYLMSLRLTYSLPEAPLQ